MQWWQMARQGLQGLFLVSLIFMGCAAPGGESTAEGCGGLEASVSCLDITQIVPTATAGGNSSNVDAFQNACFDPVSGNVTGVEPFTDHAAEMTFTNTRFPTASGSFDIRILGFTVSYTLNQCPAQAIGCPPLTGFTVSGESILIPHDPSGQAVTVTATLPFVPLRVKNEFCASGGERGSAIPSYTATYTFTAQTTRFNETFTVTGSAEFTIGNFVDSGFSCAAPGIVVTVPCRP